LYICALKCEIMTTITINERTKAGKTLLELANLLATSNKGVTINTGLGKPISTKELTAKDEDFLKRLRRSAKHAREIGAGTRKGIPIKTFLDEL